MPTHNDIMDIGQKHIPQITIVQLHLHNLARVYLNNAIAKRGYFLILCYLFGKCHRTIFYIPYLSASLLRDSPSESTVKNANKRISNI